MAMGLNKALYKHYVFSDELVVVHGVPREGRGFVLQAQYIPYNVIYNINQENYDGRRGWRDTGGFSEMGYPP